MKFGSLRNRAACLFVAFMTAAVGSGIAQPESKGRGTLRTPLLEVQFSMQKTNLLVGEPLNIITEARRLVGGASMMQFSSRMFFPEGNDLAVTVQRAGETEFLAEGAMPRSSYVMFANDLPPFGSVRIARSLQYEATHPSGFLFDKPGEYRVQARLKFVIDGSQTHEVKIPTTIVTVSAVEGDAAKAFAALSKPSLAKSLEIGRATDPDALKALQDVATNYPDSPYAERCLRTAALTIMGEEKPDYKAAMTLMRRYIDRYADSESADEIVNALAGAFHMIGDRDAASAWMWHLHLRYPQSIFLRTQNPIFVYYLERPAETASVGPWYLMDKPWIDPSAVSPTSLLIQAKPQ